MNFRKKLQASTNIEFLLIAGTAIYNYQNFDLSKLGGNSASRVLLAIGPLLKIGEPYKDLYEVVPPGFLLLISGWVHVFGISIYSFKMLHILFIFLSGLLLLLICRQLFRRRVVELLVFSSTLLVMHSGVVQTDFFSIDFLGTTFSLGALAALYYVRDPIFKLFTSATVILIASQMKDVYILSMLTLLPIYLRELLQRNERSFFKLFFLSMAGPLMVVFAVMAYLMYHGALESYIEVLHDKLALARYSSPNVIFADFITMIQIFEKNFLWVPKLIEVLIIVNVFLALIFFSKKFKERKLPFLPENVIKETGLRFNKWLNNYGRSRAGNVALILVFIFSLLLGLTLYGQYSVDTRFIGIACCLYLFLGLLVIHPVEIIQRLLKKKILRILVTVFLLILLMPQKAIFKRYTFATFHGKHNFDIEKEIMKKTDKNDCILHIYGWEVSPTYIYTQRRPCSKYFLTNLLHLIRRRRIALEYREQIFNNPPAAIIYNTLDTDFNIDRFEREVMNLPNILLHCYVADPRYKDFKGYFFAPITLYWPKTSDKEQLKTCFTTYGQPT